jgi:hypothetical protein
MAIIVAHLPQVLPTSEKELHTLLSVLKAISVRIYDNQRVVEGGLLPSGSPDASRFVDKSQVRTAGQAWVMSVSRELKRR